MAVGSCGKPARRKARGHAPKSAQEQLKRLLAQEQLADYITGMKQRVEVKVKPDWMEKGVSYLDRGKRDVSEYYKRKITTEQPQTRK